MSNPPPVDVGRMYDTLTDTFAKIMGGCLHFGYWRDERDDSPLSQACEQLTDLVIGKSLIAKDHHVLDVGCGTGIPALHIASTTGARVTGITVSAHQIKIARANAQAAGIGEQVTFQLADAMILPFPNASFNSAVAIESLLHMSDQAAALAHIARILRKGGRLVVADFFLRQPVSEEKKSFLDDMVTIFASNMQNTATEWHRLVEQAGLELEDLVDLSDNVRRTYTLVTDAIRSDKAITEYVGEQKEATSDLAGIAKDFQELGYMLLIAKRVD